MDFNIKCIHIDQYLWVSITQIWADTHLSILPTDMNIMCVSYKLPVSSYADRQLGLKIHAGTDTCQICTDLGYEPENACGNTHMHWFWRILTDTNMFQKYVPDEINDFTAESAQWLGLLHSLADPKVPGFDSWCGYGNFGFWLKFWGAYRGTTGRPFLRTNLKIKKTFEKLWVCHVLLGGENLLDPLVGI